MRLKRYSIIVGLVVFILLGFGVVNEAYGQVSNARQSFWKRTGNVLQPILSTLGVQMENVTTTGSLNVEGDLAVVGDTNVVDVFVTNTQNSGSSTTTGYMSVGSDDGNFNFGAGDINASSEIYAPTVSDGTISISGGTINMGNGSNSISGSDFSGLGWDFNGGTLSDILSATIGNLTLSGSTISSSGSTVTVGDNLTVSGGVTAQSATSTGNLYVTDNVGIGTESPRSLLSVESANASTASYIDIGTNNTARHARLGYNNSDIFEINWDDGDDLQFGVHDNAEDFTPSPLVTIKGGGNVGIGTDSPDSQLNIENDGTTEDQLVIGNTGDTDAKFVVRNSSGDYPFVRIFNTAGTEAVRFDPAGTNWIDAGNVGIGDTSPKSKLEVNQGAQWSSANYGDVIAITGTRNNALAIESSSGDQPWAIANISSGDKLVINAMPEIGNTSIAPSTTFALLRTGNVGIGTDSPGSRLTVVESTIDQLALFQSNDATARITVKDSSDNTYFGTQSGITFIGPDITASGDNLLIDNSNGYVGVGISPSRRLHIETPSTANQKIISVRKSGGGAELFFVGQTSQNGHLGLSDASNNVNVMLDSSGVSYLSGGNVGIGTTTPESLLVLEEPADTDTRLTIASERSTGYPDAEIYFNSAGNTGKIAMLKKNGSGDNALYLGADGGVVLGAVTDESFTVDMSNREIYMNADLHLGDKLIHDTGNELTIATGAITVTDSWHTVDTQGDASDDDLDTINGGVDGEQLILTAEHTDRTITITESGNIDLAGIASFALNSTEDTVTLLYRGDISTWIELARSNNN